ncbi:DUF3040 domain-containing protein [Pseudonocardia sp. DSM 110487]|uniref:DUF3040 domain-containing protein n=1 Tax=Pseudonocardia sp. DSM 110487 TaxID=2865833 RepID=UPI001C695819|nr:DUF3040 domain-containing protein [Pseudonocardia sp. DSM 110487]QYN36179.1 DUF3040 domain-containing protein [Pseudonocardia sp. DSM 110487]
MTASSTPGHDDHDALSEWERRALADIERGLIASDPRLVRELSRRRRYRSAPRWWPVSVPTTGLLLAGLLVLVLVGELLPASWWAVLGLVTVLVVVPWLLLAATEKNGWD